jgi:glyoxylase-like metal-dependent hydrolase (beta-lactamase superfamily II)
VDVHSVKSAELTRSAVTRAYHSRFVDALPDLQRYIAAVARPASHRRQNDSAPAPVAPLAMIFASPANGHTAQIFPEQGRFHVGAILRLPWYRAIPAAESKRTQWKPTYGKGYPDSTCVPDHVAPHSGSVRIDGLEFQFQDYGPGEASGEATILAPALRAAFVGDLIYDQVHPWLAEGRSAQWLVQLDRLTKDIPADWTVYPGARALRGVAVIDAQRQYITEFRAAIQAQLDPSGLVPDSTKGIVEGVRARYPGWPLEMLIPINAEAVAKELSKTAAH